MTRHGTTRGTAQQGARLEVFTVLGQRLRILLEDVALATGGHQVIWDGRDEGGRALPSGVYLTRLQVAGSGPQTRRVLLLR
ncbi:MAG: hypothetical protein AB1505_16560 [Candidatus Latescibacterota bacterium]